MCSSEVSSVVQPSRRSLHISIALVLALVASVLFGYASQAGAQADDRYELVQDEYAKYVLDHDQNTMTWAEHCTNLGTPRNVEWSEIEFFVEGIWAECPELSARLSTNTGTPTLTPVPPTPTTTPAPQSGDRYELVEDEFALYVLDHVDNTITWADHCSLGTPRTVQWSEIEFFVEGIWAECIDLSARLGTPPVDPDPITLPPANGNLDYRIGDSTAPASWVDVVSLDWYDAPADLDADPAYANRYSICYVNAFQMQEEGDLASRHDHPSQYLPVAKHPALDEVWGEKVIDISSEAGRNAAFIQAKKMIDVCDVKNFDAVEFDNLDTFFRFQEYFTIDHAVAYASMLVDYTHSKGLAAAQKNTVELQDANRADEIGFDFALVEKCGHYTGECAAFAAYYGNQVFMVEYYQSSFDGVCAALGSTHSVVLLDDPVEAPSTNADVPRSHC